MNASLPKLIALYVPQYHPIPENDLWWGKGFTEWTNVAKSKPLYPGHYQPRIPADLGFYDLRLPEVRDRQAMLAMEHGLYGFCYYHFWFAGQQLLNRPFDEVLQSGEPRFPFCLCWVNETWSRRWLGEEKNILIEQTYSEEDDHTHARWLMHAFADRRYIRIGERPLFFIYRPTHLPDPHRTNDTIRSTALKAGLPDPYLVGVDAHRRMTDYRQMGFDTTLNFTPQLGLLADAFNDGFSASRLVRNARKGILSGDLKVYDYETAWRIMFEARPAFPHIPTVFVGWDNTPRRGRDGIIIANSTPQKFAEALRQTLASVDDRANNERIVIIDAWNEWAEGNYLEPDMKHGRAYLEAVRNVLAEHRATPR